MLAAVLLLAGSLDPGSQGYPARDPYRATSPSGRHFVEVVPSTRQGDGACTLLIGESQRIVADERVPETLRDACIDDAGNIAGWCGRGIVHEERPKVLLRVHGGWTRAIALPAQAQEEFCRGAGLVLQPEHARALLRVDRRQAGRRIEEWWPIALPGGEWGERILPERLQPLGPAWNTQCFEGLAALGQHDALLARDYGHYTVYDADGHALWDHSEWCNVRYLCGGPTSSVALGPFPEGFTLRMPCEWQPPDSPDALMEQRYYRTSGACLDLCVEEVGRRTSPDEPCEPAPPCRSVQLERAGAPRAFEQAESAHVPHTRVFRSHAQSIAKLLDGHIVWSDGLGTHAWTTFDDDPEGMTSVQFTQRLDGKWLGWIREALPLPEGELAILDNACRWRGEDKARIVIFSERGEPREQFTLPTDLVWGLRARGDWVCAHAWYEGKALLVRRSTREVFEFPLGPGGYDRELLLPTRADELWVLDPKSRQVERFRLPGS